jgi:hypothetical protein
MNGRQRASEGPEGQGSSEFEGHPQTPFRILPQQQHPTLQSPLPPSHYGHPQQQQQQQPASLLPQRPLFNGPTNNGPLPSSNRPAPGLSTYSSVSPLTISAPYQYRPHPSDSHPYPQPSGAPPAPTRYNSQETIAPLPVKTISTLDRHASRESVCLQALNQQNRRAQEAAMSKQGGSSIPD